MDTPVTAPIVVESLRPGMFPDTSGRAYTFTRADLDDIAASYDPDLFKAPVVIGHPQNNHPAWGWIDRAIVGADDKLRVEFSAVDPAFAAAVDKGHYQKVSLALFAPATPGNPTPGKWYIRHLGYLGGAAPAITGLKSADFAGPAEGIVEFAGWDELANAGLWRSLREWFINKFGLEEADRALPGYEVASVEDGARAPDPSPETSLSPAFATSTTQEVTVTEQEAAQLRAANARLQTQLAAAQAAELAAKIAAAHQSNVEFAASLTGSVPPAQQARLVSVLDALEAAAQPVEFAAANGGSVSEPPAAALRAVLSAIPNAVPTGEAAADKGAEFAAGSDAASDPAQLAREASALMSEAARDGRPLDSAAAVNEVIARRGR